MSGDFSRRTYDPRRDVAGVFEQQGRVRVDADLNELVEVVDRRLRTTSMDVFHASAGRVVVPAETPDAFKITIAGGGLTIGPGRAYVDGIQADNHGIGVPPPAALHFDGGIEEKIGTDPLPFSPQPYLPTPVAVPPQGTHIAYLDVWHRERTKDEDPELLDPALYGIDTATRRQIVWQVKLLTNVDGARCDMPVDQIKGWPLASAARLTTAAVGVPAADDPCEIPAIGGYRGVTNRLYRVEIHDGGGFGAATFTWSRNGGSGGTSILAINGAAITVAQLGRDKYVRFATGDWVEVLDDVRELEGRPGEMAKVDRVDEARGIVTLTAPLAGPFPSPATNGARLRKWDQRVGVPPSGVFPVTNAPVVLEDGVQIQFSLDAEIIGGEFKSHEYWLFAARAADSSVEELDTAPPVGPHHHAGKLAIVDTAAGTVVDCRHPWPPSGGGEGCECDECVHADEHNVDGLGIQRAVDAVRGKGGIVCLEAGIYILRRPVRITKATSITIRGKGWRTIVLTPGDLPAFIVEQSIGVTIEELSVFGVRNREGFTGTTLVDSPNNPSLNNASLNNLAASNAAAAKATLRSPAALLRLAGGQTAIALSNSVHVLLQRCVLAIRPTVRLDAPVVALQGILADLTIRENVILGSVGIGTLLRTKVARGTVSKANAPTLTDHYESLDTGDSVAGTSAAAKKRQTTAARLSRLLLVRSRIGDNIIGGLVAGVALGPFAIFAADNTVADNTLVAPLIAGTLHMGIAVLGCTTVRGNTVYAGGFGIASGLDGMRVEDNDVFGFSIGRGLALDDADRATIGPSYAASSAASAVLSLPVAGIMLVDGLGFNRPLEGARVSGNRVTGVRGFGILGASRVATVDVDHNLVSECALGGIVLLGISGGAASIDGNTVERIGRTAITSPKRSASADLGFYLENFLAGIAVVGMLDADVRDNRVELVVSQVRDAAPLGVLLLSCGNSRVAGNRVVDIGDDSGYSAGIAVAGTFDKADVVDDHVRMGSRFNDDAGRHWNGIIVSGFNRKAAVDADAAAVGNVVFTAPVAAPQRLSVGRANPYFAEIADGKLLRVIPVGRELIAVRGNTVDGNGPEAMILAFGSGHTTVSDNRVIVNEPVRQAGIAAVGSSLIANANYVELGQKEPAMQLGTFTTGAGTVLGNVTQGTIEFDGNNIQAVPPWAALNVSA